MKFDSVIYLVSTTPGQDRLLNTILIESEPRKVYADLFSISQAEFAAAGQQGLRPDSAYQINMSEYSGEQIVKVDGQRLHVYRTAPRGDRITLYLTEDTSDGRA